MSARTLFGLAFVLAMLTRVAFAEGEQRDERNNPKSPQYKEHADILMAFSRARLNFPEAGEGILCLLIVQQRADPAHFTDEMRTAIRDCQKLYIRANRYENRVVTLLADPNLFNQENKVRECKEYTAKYAACATNINERWKFVMNALTADEWKAAEEEVDKDEAVENEQNDKGKEQK